MPVETNIVIFELDDHHHGDEFVSKLNHHGVKCNTFGKQMIRFVTHLDVSPDSPAAGVRPPRRSTTYRRPAWGSKTGMWKNSRFLKDF